MTGALDRLWQDTRYALRLLRRSPVFTAVAVFTLTLAVAANSTIFSIVEGVMLRPLAYKDAGELVAINQVNPRVATGPQSLPVAAVHFLEWRTRSNSFTSLSLLNTCNLQLTGSGEPENVPGACVSSNLFSTLGVTPQLGRTFAPEEEEPGRERVVILSHEFWRRRFHEDRDIIGRMIIVGGASHEVIGVLPAAFRFPLISQLYPVPLLTQPERPQMWEPIVLARFEREPRLPIFTYASIGRLKPDVTPERAVAELNTLQASLTVDPNGPSHRVAMLPLQDRITGNYRPGLILMWASVGAVLLISCVNVANLLLARATRRRSEMALRSAVGASRGRIARQMLVESLVLSAVSGALGLAGAYGLIRLAVAYVPGDVPRLDEVGLDLRVLLFTLGIVIVDGVIFGVLPAWRSSRTNPQDALRSSSSRTSTGGREVGRLRAMLVSAQVGLCAMCLIVGALLLQSFARVMSVQRGFDVADIATVEIAPSIVRYPLAGPDAPRRVAFLQSALERTSNLPGITSVGLSNMLPLTGEGPGMALILDGSPVSPLERPTARIRMVNPSFFRTMGIPLKDGRLFKDDDTTRAVALVSSQTAQRLWQSEHVIGQHIRLRNETGPVVEVLGVVGDARTAALTREAPFTVYLPYWQPTLPVLSWSLAFKTTSPVAMAGQVRAALRELDAELPIPAFRTMEEILAGSVGQRRFQMNIVLLFAAVGLLLSTVGIYGLVAYSVAQRTNELGVRIALGAQPAAIQWLVIRQALVPIVPGLALGVAAAFTSERILSTLLFDVSAHDPTTIVAVIGLLMLVSFAASYFPARRATRVNPVVALRVE